MKFGTVRQETGQAIIACKETEKYLLLQSAAERHGNIEIPVDLLACIKEGDRFLEKADRLYEWAEKQADTEGLYLTENDGFVWEAPIPRPAKNVFCVGKNYAEHALELGTEADIPEHIMLFTKAPTTVIGHEADIPLHSTITDQLDYEGELAVIIGKTGKAIKQEEALDYVFGYTVLNDVTARDLQAKHKQFFLGKSLDGTCPIGPYIVDSREIQNPNSLAIETKVNGEIRQSASTEQLIFPVEEIISVISRGMTLEPGDIIATGTPAGVGKGYKPPKFLKKGDEIEITAEGIGTLRNRVH